jgi:hypothetical protein
MLANFPTGGKKYHGPYNGVCVGYCGFYRGSLFIAEGSLFIADVWHWLMLRALQVTLKNAFTNLHANPPSWGS